MVFANPFFGFFLFAFGDTLFFKSKKECAENALTA